MVTIVAARHTALGAALVEMRDAWTSSGVRVVAAEAIQGGAAHAVASSALMSLSSA